MKGNKEGIRIRIRGECGVLEWTMYTYHTYSELEYLKSGDKSCISIRVIESPIYIYTVGIQPSRIFPNKPVFFSFFFSGKFI
jgi:hypothetical protein